jgi:hypothetical protein
VRRDVGTVPTDRFLDSLGFTPVNPPNAAIVVEDSDGQRDVLVVELMNPVYIEDLAGLGHNSLVYEAKILENYQGEGLEYWEQQQVDEKLAEGFSNVSLFIDDCPGSDYCYRSSTFTCEVVGGIPGGSIGNCWDKDNWICVPCSHSLGYYYDLCNQAYPAAGQGQCVISNSTLLTC